MLVDTHCHLWNREFSDVAEVVARAKQAGVEKMVVPGTNIKTATEAINLAKKYPGVIYAAVGWYPGELKNTKSEARNIKQIEILETLIKQNREQVVAIGEIGLDSYWLERQPELELELFERQMKLALELNLPVVVHNRGADNEIKQVLSRMNKLPQGHFHCFSGSGEWLTYLTTKGFYVGLCGNVTYKSNRELREVVKMIPDDRLLLETDSPYLPPQGKRGERNEPANVKITAQNVSETREITLEKLENLTTENARRLYGI